MSKKVNTRNSQSKGKENYKKGFETEDRDLNSSKRRNVNHKSTQGRDFICSEGKPTNDPKWYINNPVLSRDVGTLFFSHPTGELFNTFKLNEKYDAGVAVYDTAITWGGAQYDDPSSIINLTAQKLYQYVVHANSRNTSYDKKDLIISCMAIDAVYAVITEAIRAYRLIAQYKPQNMYVARLLTLSGWDIDDLKEHVAEFRYYINWAITRINKFYMPALFDIVKAHTSCYENIYLDRPDMKAQMYVKRSAGVWLYTDELGTLEFVREVRNDHDTFTTWYDGINTNRTVNTFKDVINAMISNIESSQYMGVMQGDMLKAFGPELMSNYGYIGIDMPIEPVYDEEFLFKLHNGFVHNIGDEFWVGTYPNSERPASSGMIYRDSDGIDGITMLYGPTWGDATLTARILGRLDDGDLVDLPAGIAPTSDNVMLMSLYKAITPQMNIVPWRLEEDNVNCCAGDVAPEMLLKCIINYDPRDIRKRVTTTSIEDVTDSDSDAIRRYAYASRFSVFHMLRKEDGSRPIYWQTNNTAEISPNLVQRILKVVFWSLWSSQLINSSDATSRDTRV